MKRAEHLRFWHRRPGRSIVGLLGIAGWLRWLDAHWYDLAAALAAAPCESPALAAGTRLGALLAAGRARWP